MPKVQIELPSLFEGQKQLLSSAKRYNVVRCGRRWGKTVVAAELLIQPALDGYPTAYFTPVYETLEEVWEQIIETLEPIIVKKNAQRHWVKLKTGGIIKCWSLQKANNPRGKKYKRAVVDEAAFIDELMKKWEKVIRPMLADYQGDAWFFSSPVADTDFEKLDKKSIKNPKWNSFHRPTWNNPFIKEEEIKEIKEETIADIFNQEYAAEYVNFNGKNFIQYWNKEEQVKSNLQWDPYLDTFFCFDFNITNTVLIIQNPPNFYLEKRIIRVLKEYHLDLFDLETLCKQLLAEYQGAFIRINGDASGKSRSALTQGNQSAYDIVKSKLRITFDHFNVPDSNPSHINSYIHCNTFFKNHIIEIDESCEGLINDIEKVKIESIKGKVSIVKSDDKLTHHLDPLRYHIHAEHQYVLHHLEEQE